MCSDEIKSFFCLGNYWAFCTVCWDKWSLNPYYLVRINGTPSIILFLVENFFLLLVPSCKTDFLVLLRCLSWGVAWMLRMSRKKSRTHVLTSNIVNESLTPYIKPARSSLKWICDGLLSHNLWISDLVDGLQVFDYLWIVNRSGCVVLWLIVQQI